MSLIEDLKKLDEKKERSEKTNKGVKKSTNKYKVYSDWITNREKIKKILENPDPKLDIPILATKNYYYIVFTSLEAGRLYNPQEEKKGKQNVVITERIMKLWNYIEEMSNEHKLNKITYEKSYRKATEKDKNEIMHMKNKIKMIYSSDEKDDRCVALIDLKRFDDRVLWYYRHTGVWLPYVPVTGKVKDDTFGARDENDEFCFMEGIGVDTTLKYALLANVSDEMCFEKVIQSPKKLMDYEMKLREAQSSKSVLGHDVNITENTSNITFKKIKDAIKEKLLGKGER